MNELYDQVVVPGYHVYKTKPTSVTAPAIVLGDPEVTYGVTFGLAEVQFTATILFTNPAQVESQLQLREAVDPEGVPAVLGEYGFDVRRSSKFFVTSIGEGEFLAADLFISIQK